MFFSFISLSSSSHLSFCTILSGLPRSENAQDEIVNISYLYFDSWLFSQSMCFSMTVFISFSVDLKRSCVLSEIFKISLLRKRLLLSTFSKNLTWTSPKPRPIPLNGFAQWSNVKKKKKLMLWFFFFFFSL